MSVDKLTISSLTVNPSQRTPCVLVLDVSHSMTSPTSRGTRRIDELNVGLKTLETELKDNPVAKMRIQLAIVSVGGPAGGADKMMDWTDAVDFIAFDMTCGGEKPLAEGLEISLKMIEDQTRAYKTAAIAYTRPLLMVLADGQPTDTALAWERAASACRNAEDAKKCVIFPIGVGDADIPALQQISSTVPRTLDETRFKELFVWLSQSLTALSQSPTAVSQSTPGQTLPLGSTDPWRAVKL